jgi:hypothetical protein
MRLKHNALLACSFGRCISLLTLLRDDVRLVEVFQPFFPSLLRALSLSPKLKLVL